MRLNIAVFCLLAFFSLQAHAGSYAPSPELLKSPVLLVDFARWARESEAFTREGTETRAFQDIVQILYDREIDRQWGDQYFPEANLRFEALRAKLCPAFASLPFCSVSEALKTDADLQLLAESLLAPSMVGVLSGRWQLRIDRASFPNTEWRFNLVVGQKVAEEKESISYWDLAGTVERLLVSPLLSDLGTYSAGLEPGAEFPGQFGFSSGKVLFNDWKIRDRAMSFAREWKLKVEMNRDSEPVNLMIDGEAIQLQLLFDENQGAFARYYEQLLPKTIASDETHGRFLEERAAKNYPEEVYQRVAYDFLSDLLRTQTAYYDLARRGSRKNTSERQKRLESLLALQRYTPAWRIFLLEASGLSEPLASHGAILDETIDQGLALTYFLEQFKAVLGLDVYSESGLFSRLKYAVLDQSLFEAYYLEHSRPQIFAELKQADGNIKRVQLLPEADQLRLLRSYLVGEKGGFDAVAVHRMALVFATQIKEIDLRDLADQIHIMRSGSFH